MGLVDTRISFKVGLAGLHGGMGRLAMVPCVFLRFCNLSEKTCGASTVTRIPVFSRNSSGVKQGRLLFLPKLFLALRDTELNFEGMPGIAEVKGFRTINYLSHSSMSIFRKPYSLEPCETE